MDHLESCRVGWILADDEGSGDITAITGEEPERVVDRNPCVGGHLLERLSFRQ